MTTMHMSHLFMGRLSAVRLDAIGAILEPHRAYVVTYNDPARGPMAWIESPNRGGIENRQREQDITRSLERAGLGLYAVKGDGSEND